MATPRDTWRTMSPLARTVAVGGLALAVGALALGGAFAAGAIGRPSPSQAADLGTGPEPTAVPPGTSLPPLPPTPTPDLSASPSPSPSPLPPGADPLLGTDGRLTVL